MLRAQRWWYVALLVVGIAALACSGGAGSSLNACASPNDIHPGAPCASGASCPSADALPDCPGSAGSLVCTCVAGAWACVDPNANACDPDAGDEDGDNDGDDDASDAGAD